MAKTVQKGPISLSVSAANGEVTATASVSLSGSIGGGEAAGIGKGSVSVNVSAVLEDQEAVDLGFALLEAKLPSLAVEIEVLKGLADAGIQKLTV
jgi:hypothetical protein